MADDWITWGEWVKDNIKTCKSDIEKLEKDVSSIIQLVTDLRLDHRTIQVKSGVWGVIGSAITICATLLLFFLKESVTHP